MTTHTQPGELVEPLQDPISAMEQAGGVVSMLTTVALIALVGLRRRRRPAWLALAGAALSGLAAVLWIFRSPERRSPVGPDWVLAPCDGEVVAVAEVLEPHFLKAAAQQITVRVRPGDMQVMRAPVGGFVRYRRYQPGGRAGEPDDSLSVGIHQSDGNRVLLRLVANRFWRALPSFAGRRITALPDLEDALQPGQIVGHLPVGGHVQIFLPRAAQLTVSTGQRLRGGETVLAQL